MPALIRKARLFARSIREMRGDAAYDSRKNLDLLKGMKIEPIINVRRGASMKTKGGAFARAKVVAELHRSGLKEWKKVKDYGRRWVSEIFNSAFKRVIGEPIRARKMKNMIREGELKMIIYLKLRVARLGQ